MRRSYYWPVLLVSLYAPLFWGTAWAAEPPPVSIDPALVRGPAEAPVTIVEFADYQ